MTRKVRKAHKRKPRAVTRRDPLDAVIDANAKMFALKIDKAWKAAIRAHLQVTLRHGALVQDFKLPDNSEPSPVFEP